MKELKGHSGLDWSAWFWVDKEAFAGGDSALCRDRIEKAVGRDSKGTLLVMVWINTDASDWHKFRQVFYEIDEREYITFLDRAIEQGEVKPQQRERLIAKMRAPFIPLWDRQKDVVVYRDDRYTLGQKYGTPYLLAGAQRYGLSCHPYEPCLYIDAQGCTSTTVHNAFDPFDVLEAFYYGKTITSITGRQYDAKDFCRMVEYAAGRGEIGFDVAEKVFGGRPKENLKPVSREKIRTVPESMPDLPVGGKTPDDPFYDLIAAYPDCAVEYCIVQDDLPYNGLASHWHALAVACRKLFADGETDWQFDVGKARGKKIGTDALFARSAADGVLTYRKAFLDPPHGNSYTAADFDRVNRSLFPNGTDALDVYDWTTDWSDYFDEGHEWWGALCRSVYDASLGRYVVLMASATD